ncbi:MAG: flagellin N-terminal helical domain-containing protein [Pseudomonadales bacterium]
MTVINTNIAATITANSMKTNARAMETSMERLSTGKRINSASDDAAGLAIETRMTSQIRGLQQAARGANDGIALLQTADGAAAEISNMFQRMRELAVQAQSGTLAADDLTNLNQEFAALANEIDRVATDTTFNNKAIIGGDAGAIKIMVGADEADGVTFTTKSLELNTTAVYTIDLDNMMAAGTPDDAETAGVIGHLDDAIKGIAAERASYGATINRLEYAVDTLNATILNTQAARSQIVDADYAAETTELARTQIISQASTAMLSQANQAAQSVLALLK